MDIIDGTLYYQFLVSPNALTAQDALGEVSFDKGIDLLNDTQSEGFFEIL